MLKFLVYYSADCHSGDSGDFPELCSPGVMDFRGFRRR